MKGLCEKFHGIVYLTARDVARGQEAVAQLNKVSLRFKKRPNHFDKVKFKPKFLHIFLFLKNFTSAFSCSTINTTHYAHYNNSYFNAM